MRSLPVDSSNATRSVNVPPTSTPMRSVPAPLLPRAVCSTGAVGIESHPMRKMLLFVSLCAAALGCNSTSKTDSERTPQILAPPRAIAEVDTQTTLSFLASDEMEGRGIGTKGLDRAADFIATEFQRIGLQPMAGNDDYFQTFEMTTATEVGPKTSLKVADRSFTVKE